MRWKVHGETVLYDSAWVAMHLADVELPDGTRLDHHVVRLPAPAAGVVVVDPDRGVLLLWRHRFITDTWGWEVPAGRIEAGETIEDGAAREVEEETGWRPGPLRLLTTYHPTSGLSDHTFHLFSAAGATEIGPPTDTTEAERVAWVDPLTLRSALQDGRIHDGLSLSALCWALAFGIVP
jgi:8-oxo-dGTP pyrophosphatase MutT (NUDIX family)